MGSFGIPPIPNGTRFDGSGYDEQQEGTSVPNSYRELTEEELKAQRRQHRRETIKENMKMILVILGIFVGIGVCLFCLYAYPDLLQVIFKAVGVVVIAVGIFLWWMSS